MTEPEGIRLQKVLAAAGVASRRASEILISEGRVEVNGKVVSENKGVESTRTVTPSGLMGLASPRHADTAIWC